MVSIRKGGARWTYKLHSPIVASCRDDDLTDQKLESLIEISKILKIPVEDFLRDSASLCRRRPLPTEIAELIELYGAIADLRERTAILEAARMAAGRARSGGRATT